MSVLKLQDVSASWKVNPLMMRNDNHLAADAILVPLNAALVYILHRHGFAGLINMQRFKET